MNKQNTSDKLPIIEFSVFPNTGHQYLFVPFEKSFLSTYDTGRKIVRQCTGNHKPWLQYKGPDPDGKEITYSWIRYRYGVDASNTPGIWLAVETNVGTIRRGSFYDEREVTSVPENKEEWTVSPYAYKSLGHLNLQSSKDSYDVLLMVPDPENTAKSLQVAQIQVIWQKVEGHIDVDLVIDFGNTRTVVLALENNKDMAKNGLSGVCFPIPFLPRGHEYPRRNSAEAKKACTIADSWFLIQEPAFSESDMPIPGLESAFHPSQEFSEQKISSKKTGLFGTSNPKSRYILTQRVPQMFVEISPVIMGEEAGELLANIDLNPGQNVSMSSPKRYLWDNAPCGGTENSMSGTTPWCMNPNPWSNRKRRDRQQTLAGQICRYMYMDGRDWDIDNPPFENKERIKRPVCVPDQPVYPRSMAMVWSALYILESAYRQITSFNWRKGNLEYINRRIRSVNVTFPSGWIAGELNAYRRAWKQAVDIFTLSHFESRENVSLSTSEEARPLLRVELDEAVASQLPFIYSEICRLDGANTWIKLYGRPSSKRGGDIVRVMTIDIGGGTMDSSIVEYRNTAPGSQVALRYKVLFRDCNSFAGDSVMLRIIQRVLLPSILEAKGIYDEEDDIAYTFDKVLSRQRDCQSDRAKWQRITKMFFLPVVRQWLTDTANCPSGVYMSPDGQSFRTVQMLIDECGVDESAIVELNEYLADGGLDANFIDPDDRLMYKPDLINECIQECLEYGIAPLGKFISAYDVDLVTLSGKISEMPKVAEMLRDMLPICSQRIIRMKEYMAGDWYPMSGTGRIKDAKTVTAVGAALFIAGRNSLITNWALGMDGDGSGQAMKNYWGITRSKSPGFGDEPFLAPKDMSNEDRQFSIDGVTYKGSPVMANAYIGRQKYKSDDAYVEQQYILKWKAKDESGNLRPVPPSPLAVVFERCEGEDDDIRLVSVTSTDPEYQGITENDVELMLCTLPPEGFWMDECRFHVEYE